MKYIGDLEIRTRSDVEKYAGLTEVTGYLHINAGAKLDALTSVGGYLPKDDHGNQHNCALSQLDAGNNLVFSQTQQHIALLGVSDLMVIATGDALLVAHRSQAEKLKKLVDGLPKELR